LRKGILVKAVICFKGVPFQLRGETPLKNPNLSPLGGKPLQ
jgi:hypothetical protein